MVRVMATNSMVLWGGEGAPCIMPGRKFCLMGLRDFPRTDRLSFRKGPEMIHAGPDGKDGRIIRSGLDNYMEIHMRN